MDGVNGKQKSCYEAGASVQEQATEVKEEDAHHGVKTHVQKVVGWGAQLAEQVIEAEGENSERSVGFMAPLLKNKTRVWY